MYVCMYGIWYASNQGMLSGVVSLHGGQVSNGPGHGLVRDLDEPERHLVGAVRLHR